MPRNRCNFDFFAVRKSNMVDGRMWIGSYIRATE